METCIKKQSGQLLLEILVITGVVAIIGSIAAQLIYVSLQSNKSAGERNVALGLSEETFEAAKNVATERWLDIFNLAKGTGTSYYVQASSTKWVLVQGSETSTINNVDYGRYLTIQNVCRDNSTRNITGIADSNGSSTACTASGGSYDPSTEKITISVKWADNAEEISSGEYITRWRNKACGQTSWTSQSGGTSTCPASVYGSASNLTTGDSLQIAP